MSDKQIWVPKTETNATVRDGVVVPWEQMRFEPIPVAKSKTGFQSDEGKG